MGDWVNFGIIIGDTIEIIAADTVNSLAFPRDLIQLLVHRKGDRLIHFRLSPQFIRSQLAVLVGVRRLEDVL
jgi:hypothetical protein